MTSCLRIVPKFSTPYSFAMLFSSRHAHRLELGDVQRRGDLVALVTAGVRSDRVSSVGRLDRRGRRTQFRDDSAARRGELSFSDLGGGGGGDAGDRRFGCFGSGRFAGGISGGTLARLAAQRLSPSVFWLRLWP